MKKILRHPLSWVGLALLIAIFAFLLFPETTDTGEEPETEPRLMPGENRKKMRSWMIPPWVSRLWLLLNPGMRRRK